MRPTQPVPVAAYTARLLPTTTEKATAAAITPFLILLENSQIRFAESYLTII